MLDLFLKILCCTLAFGVIVLNFLKACRHYKRDGGWNNERGFFYSAASDLTDAILWVGIFFSDLGLLFKAQICVSIGAFVVAAMFIFLPIQMWRTKNKTTLEIVVCVIGTIIVLGVAAFLLWLGIPSNVQFK